MVRSMRFAPLCRPIEPFYQGMQLTSEPLDKLTTSESKNTSIHLDRAATLPIDPSEHAAQLIHAAVTKPTVLPATYSIPENPGDRISKLSQTQAKASPQKQPANLPPVTQTSWAKISPPEPAKALPAEPKTEEAADRVSILVPDAPVSETPVAEMLAQATETGTWVEPETAIEVSELATEEAEAKLAEPSDAVEETPVENLTEVEQTPEPVETPVENLTEVEQTPEETTTDTETEVLKASGESENLVAVEETTGENLLDGLSEVSETQENDLEEAPAENLTEVEETQEVETVEPVAEIEAKAPVETETPVVAEPETAPTATLDGQILDPDTIICPSCGSMEVRKNGHQNGKQRYACKDCGRQFVETAALSPGDELPTTDQGKGGPKGFGRKMKGKRKK